jgi:hypothetical protein
MKKLFVTALLILFAASYFSHDITLAGGNNKTGQTENKNTLNTPGRTQSSLPDVQFDTSNVVLKFAAISDTHIQDSNGTPSKKLAAALGQLNNRAKDSLNAVFITGDLTDYGMPAQVVELKRVFDSSPVNLSKTRFILAIGNHEYYNSQINGAVWNGGYLFKNVFGDEAYYGATDSEITAGDYHTVVNGYDFIAVNCTQYYGGVKYSDSDIAWLKAQLVKAAANHPGKPIFVGSHPNITGTNIGSNEGAYWNGSDLYNVFKDYPQVIFFCGHLHFPEQDERSIWQGDFTTVGIGSVYYCSNHSVDDETGKTFIDIAYGFETSDAYNTSQGYYVEVDRNSNVKITRLDFAHNEEIKKPWVIPAPKDDKSNLLYFTPAQEAENFGKTAPVFPADAKIKEILKSERVNKYQFQFTQAKDSDLVFSYQVAFVDNATDTVISTVSTLSDFYLYAKPSEMALSLTKSIYSPDSIMSPFKITDKNYYIKITAINCFGKKSEPLISSIIADVAEENSKNGLPSTTELLQNYPNPFNPSTTISYQLAKSGFVSLKVYDSIGREVKTLINGNQSAGYHTVQFDGSRLAAGVYFYRLNVAGYSSVKKLIQLK